MTPAAGVPRSPIRKLLIGCAVLLVVVVGVLALFVFGVFRYAGSKLHGTVPPPGDPHRFDPVANYTAIKQHAGADAELTGLRAMFVRRDGSLDLQAAYRPSPYAVYRFRRSVPAPADAPPLGAGGSADGRWYEAIEVEVARPGQLRSVRRTGGPHGGANYQYWFRGMERRADPPSGRAPAPALPPPTCAFGTLWDAAVAHGAAPTAVAIIEYGRDGYRFQIPDARFLLRFDAQCAPLA